MMGQAGVLIARMKTFPGVNFNNDWKLITFFIGGNDLCDTCTDPVSHTSIIDLKKIVKDFDCCFFSSKVKYSTANYIRNIQNTLDYFMANSPRTVVNLVMTLDVSGIVQLNGAVCRTMQK